MQSRVVIFIDAENVSAAHVAHAFGVIGSQGVLVARRAYGDFAKGDLRRRAGRGPGHADRTGG